jgi:hypothetical protein
MASLSYHDGASLPAPEYGLDRRYAGRIGDFVAIVDAAT